jgi:hypothetical protein
MMKHNILPFVGAWLGGKVYMIIPLGNIPF